MRKISGEEYIATNKLMEKAYEVGQKSTCRRSKRGAIIVQFGRIVGRGYDKPTRPELCCLSEGKESGLSLCSAMPAELMSLYDFLRNNYSGGTQGTVLYQATIGENGLISSGHPTRAEVGVHLMHTGIERIVRMKGKEFLEYRMLEFSAITIDYLRQI